MDNIKVDLGLDINDDFISVVEESLEDADKKVKLSASEKRKLALQNLNDAIKAKDLEAVESVFEDSPKLQLSNKNYNFLDLCLENFHPQITRKLLDEGLDFNISSVMYHYGLSIDITKFFIDYSKETIKSQEDLKETWMHIYKNYIFSLAKGNRLKTIMLIEKEFEDIHTSLDAGCAFIILINAPFKNNDWHKERFKKLSDDTLRTLFEDTFSKKSYFTEDRFTLKNMKFLMDILEENKNIKNIWNSVQSKNKQNFLIRKNWFDEYMPEDIEFEQTPFWQNILDIRDMKNKASEKANMSVLFNNNMFENYFRSRLDPVLINDRVVIQTYSSNGFLKTYLPRKDYIKTYLDSTLNHLNLDTYKDSNGKYMFSSPPPSFKAPSFVHNLVLSGSNLALTLVKTDEGKKKFIDCLGEVEVLNQFIANTSTKSFVSLLKAVPQLKDFKDRHGNNLGHMFIDTKREKSKTHLLAFAKIAPNWFEEKNYEGKTLINILEDNKVPASTISQIQKQLMLSSLKSEDISGSKLRSRVKHVKKKKM